MMTKQQALEKIEELKNYVQGLENKRWVPEEGESYYFTNVIGGVSDNFWNNDDVDIFRLGQGNVFKTREEAQNHADKLKAISDVVNYCYENDLVLECHWEDCEERKYNIYYNYQTKEFSSTFFTRCREAAMLPCLKSKEACEQLIKDKEKELKKIFGVE